MNYTKGEWTVKSDYNVVCGNRGVATTGGYSNNKDQENCHMENKANAQLISAAPDMYEACKVGLGLVKALLYQHPDDAIAILQKEIIERAIAKAEGK